MNALEVFKDVPIPVDYAAIQKYVTLGASDSGKTFMLARFAEQLAKADGFFVILDPVGKQHGAARRDRPGHWQESERRPNPRDDERPGGMAARDL